MARRPAREYRARGYQYSDSRHAQWWINAPRRRRRLQIIQARNAIAADPDGLGVFSTDHFIPGAASWRLAVRATGRDPDEVLATTAMRWADLVFMDRARRGRIIFNATVHTVADRLLSALEDQINATVAARLSAADQLIQDRESGFDFSEPVLTPSGAPLGRVMRFRKAPSLDSLNGKTYYAALSEEALRLSSRPEEWPTVCAGARVMTDYRYGVGVCLVLDVPTLSVPTLVMAIERFRAAGGTSYDVPVHDLADHIPVVSALLLQHAYTHACLDANDRDVPEPDREAYFSAVPAHLLSYVYCDAVELRD